MKTKSRERWLSKRAGDALAAVAPVQKQTADAIGRSQSWVSRQISGDPSGAVARFYHLIDQLSRDKRTDPTPLLMGALEVFVTGSREVAVDREVALALHSREDADEQVAQCAFFRTGDAESFARAVLRDCAAGLLLVGALRAEVVQ